jgi:flavin reductase (DIM6/NTAB) family NADH-FMN oxidoreductase RutF
LRRRIILPTSVGQQVNKGECTVAKVTRTAAPWLYPVPPVLVSCQDAGQANIITLGWCGVASSDPPIIGVGIRPERYSYDIIKRSGEFVVNIPQASQVELVDFCGTISGRDADKFARCGFTALPGQSVQAPLIAECPVNLECRVVQELSLGSHDLFLGEVLAVHYDEQCAVDHRFDLARADALVYAFGGYYRLGEALGRHGEWVRRKR